jgi:uncharacterized membrane protein
MTVQPDESISSDDKLWALLGYILSPLVPIILLLMEDKKSRPFIKYHAVQALALGAVEVVLIFLAVGFCISPLLFIYAVYCGIKAYQGEYVKIPVITDLVRNQGWV